MEASKVVWGIALFAALAVPAKAQQPVKIGLITTLSGPGGYLGADIRDAFQLAVEQEGGKLGGVPVQVSWRMTASSPDRASKSPTSS